MLGSNRFPVWIACLILCLSGCATAPQVAEKPPAPSLEAKLLDSEKDKAAGKPTQAPPAEQDAQGGYQLRPLDFEVKSGLPYMPVGAQVVTSDGKVPLSKVMKELATLKGYSISWADDVNQEQLVDVDIRPADNYWDALNNILRQVDYFYIKREQTIVVKYKSTMEYRLPMPFLVEQFTTSVGGNLLGGGEVQGKMKGEVQVNNSVREPVDFWKMIEENLTKIIQVGGGGGYYVVDRPLGIITVTAPQNTQKRIAEYVESLRKHVYRQVVIEAKIVEVKLDKTSQMGIDWDKLFNNVLSGTVEFGAGGVVYPSNGRVVSKVTLNPYSFELVLAALQQYGDTKILSNPKISLLNGRGATITVGENVTYIDKVETSIDTQSTVLSKTYTVTTSTVLSGVGLAVMANIINDNEVILYIAPITSELQEPIEYKQFGAADEGAEVGLPRVRLKEMATFAKLSDGQGIIIGGLIDKLEENDEKKTPLLGDIPFLGRFFSWEKKSLSTRELVILLRPRIVASAVE